MGEKRKLKNLPHFSLTIRYCVAYVFAAIPVGLLISYFLPGAFSPFILSAFVFPVFFYFTRSEKYSDTFRLMAWAVVVQFAIVAFISFIGQGIVTEWLYDVRHHVVAGPEVSVMRNLPEALFFSVAGLAFTAVLSFISGGALAVLLGVMAVNCTAVIAGSAGSFQSGLLSVLPWDVAEFTAHFFVAMGAASLFYMNLEHRPLTFSGPVKMLVLGASFAILGLFLEISLFTAWNEAGKTALVLK